MFLIRKFEENVYELFSKGLLFGTTHGYVGQEANAVGVINNLQDQDIIFSNHRSHGHYIARTDDVEGLMAELMGRETGICGGRGGSQHLCNKNFYSNGIQGGIVPVATGMALAEKIKGTGAITAVFLGDGTLGQGVVYESLNIASLWNIPILFVVENNQYAQSTHYKLAVAGEMVDRGKAFGITSDEISSFDVEEIFELFRKIVERVRTEQHPFFQVIHTYRFGPHSKGDDTRSEAEIAEWREKDPLEVLKPRIDSKIREEIEAECIKRIEMATHKGTEASFPDRLE